MNINDPEYQASLVTQQMSERKTKQCTSVAQDTAFFDRLVVRCVDFYKIDEEEAKWLLHAKAAHYKLLSTGQVINPFQSL